MHKSTSLNNYQDIIDYTISINIIMLSQKQIRKMQKKNISF